MANRADKENSWYNDYIMKNVDKSIYEKGIEIIDTLKAHGFEAYFVGGYVRDLIIGGKTGDTEAVDIDITTNARTEQVKAVFSDKKIVDTGIKHGMVRVMSDKKTGFEITTYRNDGNYSDSRHPDSVEFVSSLEEDLSRRDFTMNAIAMDRDGNIHDPFHGCRDIEEGVIRAVGDGEKRFGEDALRIMRALRFSAVLGFEIDEKTEKGLFSCKKGLKNISVERIYEEFKKLVQGNNAPDVLRRYVDVLGVVLPELAAMKGFEQRNPYHRYDVLEHCIRAMEAVKTTKENIGYMKMTALLHDIGKPETFSIDGEGIGHFYRHPSAGARIVREVLGRFHADRFTIDRVSEIIRHHDMIFEKDRKLLKKWMNRFTPEMLLEILALKKADNFATGNMSDHLHRKFDDIEEMIYGILNEEECFSINKLAIGGSELMEVGIKQGPEIGRILDVLLQLVMEEKLPNEKSSLMEKTAEIMKK